MILVPHENFSRLPLDFCVHLSPFFERGYIPNGKYRLSREKKEDCFVPEAVRHLLFPLFDGILPVISPKEAVLLRESWRSTGRTSDELVASLSAWYLIGKRPHSSGEWANVPYVRDDDGITPCHGEIIRWARRKEMKIKSEIHQEHIQNYCEGNELPEEVAEALWGMLKSYTSLDHTRHGMRLEESGMLA